MRRLPRSREEKIAEQIANTATDLTLDLEEVGTRLARQNTNLVYRRLMIIFEAMRFEREERHGDNI